jgi:DNA-binding transcriptional MerR regulator
MPLQRRHPRAIHDAGSGAHTAGDAPTGRRRLKMKDLERATGVGRDAIRFYIREGLLPEPERPARNVAFYDQASVERIRFIKELQQKRYLPLHVIKAMVAGDEAPTRGEVEALLALDGKLFPAVQRAFEKTSERLSQLAARVRLPAREIRALAAAGVIDVVTRDGDQWVEGSAVRIVELWSRIRAAGFSSRLGFGPDDLRLYVDTMRWLAHAELRRFAHGVAGRVPAERAARMGEQGIELVNQLLGLLRKETLLRYVATGNAPDEIGALGPGAGGSNDSG